MRCSRRSAIPVLVDNDVNTLATAERLYGRGRDVEDFITLTLGRGVGLGIVANGDIYHGHGGGAGEFGHVTAVVDGPVCSCGKRGCLEAVVGDPALVATARERGIIGKRQGVAALRRKADDGDRGSTRDLRRGRNRPRPGGRQSRQRLEPEADPRQRRGHPGMGSLRGGVREGAADACLPAASRGHRRGRSVGRREVGGRCRIARPADDVHATCRWHARRACDASVGTPRLASRGGGRLTTRSCCFPRAAPRPRAPPR